MNSKLLKRLKKITILFIMILVVEVIYVVYSVCFKSSVSLYFDSINSFDNNSSYLVTVGSNNNNDNYYEKAKITKYNKKEEIESEKLYNVGYNSAFFGVNTNKDSIVAVGSYEKNKNQHEDFIRSALIIKYDTSLEEIFEKEFSVLDNSKFTNIVTVSDGYLVTGQSVYKSTKIGSKDGGAVLVKYDLDGKLIWSKTFGNNKYSIFNDLLVNDNNIYTVGLLEDNVSVICKYDMDGNLITSKTYENTNDIGFNDIVVINDRIYVSGSINNKAAIISYDLDCNYIGEVSYDKGDDSRYNKMIVDKDNNIVLIGIISNNKDSFNYDGLIGKYDSNLKKISTVTYGEEKDDYFTDIKYVNGEYLVVGYSSYEDGSYLSKFIRYSDALKVLEVK